MWVLDIIMIKTGKDRKVVVKNPCSGDGTNGHAPNGGDHIVDYGEYCKDTIICTVDHATASLYPCVLQPRPLPQLLTAGPQ